MNISNRYMYEVFARVARMYRNGKRVGSARLLRGLADRIEREHNAETKRVDTPSDVT